jgi:predicted nucleic acid-binding protein
MSAMIDASAWIAYLEGSEEGAQVCDIVENGEAVTCILTIAELADIHARRGKPFMQNYEFIKTSSKIVELPVIACLSAGKLKWEQRKRQSSFGLADALIYLTAQEHKCVLVTKDRDFKGMKDVVIL